MGEGVADDGVGLLALLLPDLRAETEESSRARNTQIGDIMQSSFSHLIHKRCKPDQGCETFYKGGR